MGRRRSTLPPPPPAGTDGNDVLTTSGLAGTLDGRGGFDRIQVLLGNATQAITMTGDFGTSSGVRLSTGTTLLNFEAVNFSTGAGNDVLRGGAADDFFFTSNGDDVVSAGGGNDYLELGAGSNQATGGSGADRFALSEWGVVTITDFSKAEGDKLQFFVGPGDIPSSFAIENGFYRITDVNGGALIEVDQDGSFGGFTYQTIAFLQNVAAATLTADVFLPA